VCSLPDPMVSFRGFGNGSAREGETVAKRIWTVPEKKSFPVPVLRVGQRYVVAVEGLLTVLGAAAARPEVEP
jgi:hypothetical protein